MTKYNIHLWISIPIVFSAGLSYGFYPNSFLEIQPETLDESNFNKAIMGLYFGFVTLWTFGVFMKSFYKPALISHVCFMLPMALGRLLSIILDGVPSDLYIYGTIGELALGVYGIWVLKSIASQ
ncbi:hypothetical protein BTO05_08930 [Winogradskyella sp. PC-19]|nr:hypothetical protein BTO05_08930 [Winogradskyella sp. PC-19]